MSDTTQDPAQTERALTSEERLRAIAGDHKRKTGHGKAPAPVVDGSRQPGDLVDPVRDGSGRDRGRDQPL
jgi:hypothetical protein